MTLQQQSFLDMYMMMTSRTLSKGKVNLRINVIWKVLKAHHLRNNTTTFSTQVVQWKKHCKMSM
jgi:hypothetical protein